MTLPIFELAAQTAIDTVVRETSEARRQNLIAPERAKEITDACRLVGLLIHGTVREADRAGSKDVPSRLGGSGPVGSEDETRVLRKPNYGSLRP